MSSKGLLNYRHMHALSKKERVQILAIVTERVASPKELSEKLNEEIKHISYHVTVLRKAGLIKEVDRVPRRGSVEHFYLAVAPTLVPPDAWEHLPLAMRQRISVSILQRFFDDASASMEADVFDDPPGELSWTPLILDPLGVEKFGQLARGFLESVLELQSEASHRLEEGGKEAMANAVSATIFLASFLSARSPEDNMRASGMKRR